MGKRGPHPFAPTEEQRDFVATMVAAGIPLETVCHMLPGGAITRKTLSKAFKPEIESGGARANGTVANSLMRKVLAGDTTAMIWWTKTRMRWREGVDVDLNHRVYKPDGDDAELG